MTVRAPPERPMVFAATLRDRKIVDAGDAQAHQAMLVELPILVAVAAKPAAAVVVPLIGKTHRDAVVAEGPDFLDQAVVELALPLARQERHDRFAALKELRAIAPAAVAGVGERDPVGIARVPRILGHASFLGCCFERVGRKRRTAGRPSAPRSM